MNTCYSVFALFLLLAVFYFQAACASSKTEEYFDDGEYGDDDGDLGVASVSGDNGFPEDKGLDWALKEKKPVCAHCRLPGDCESGKCYFGRCVLGGIHQPHSVFHCFRFSRGANIYEREECDRCRSHKQCDSNYCRSGRCLHKGVLRELSILACFRDAYVEKC